MANMMKTNIRLRKVAERLNKNKMPKDWNSTKKRLFKLNERRERLSKWVDSIWGEMFRKGFKPAVDNTNPKYAEDFANLDRAMTERDRTVASINRLETKHALASDDLQTAFNRYNTSRRSTSF